MLGLTCLCLQTIAMHHCQEKVVHMLLIIVQFDILDVDNYFTLCGILDGPTNFVCCLACHSFYKWLWRSRVDFDVSWLNFAGTLICGIGLLKETSANSWGSCWKKFSRKSFDCNNSREEMFTNSLEATSVIATTIISFHNICFFPKKKENHKKTN
jgi:hypothetical protein